MFCCRPSSGGGGSVGGSGGGGGSSCRRSLRGGDGSVGGSVGGGGGPSWRRTTTEFRNNTAASCRSSRPRVFDRSVRPLYGNAKAVPDVAAITMATKRVKRIVL